MPVTIEGVITSREMRQQLAKAGRPVLLSFSRGKDSIAAWLALRDAGVEVIPYHLHLIPGLRFVRESLEYFAERFGLSQPILDLPHPTLYRWLNNLVFQPPERCGVIEAAQLPKLTYEQLNDMVRAHYQLPGDTWVCDGVRATDSPNRRMAIKSYGPITERLHTQKVVWDWKKSDVMGAIESAGVRLPPDYLWFGRSFDGLDKRFLAQLRTYAPDDYEVVLTWFPYADLDSTRATV
ncbi:adenine nucleotide alpha hydrolase family protein [Actinomadura rudentiformis]|uniref:Phosphoadenosine phosphosulfate reductase n=1 Tax=Actinomadura rudentiformis TaxID=359158 RepID=A0A6H9YVY2_9ACTN|nr:phosphoadenosine phosphosulfate reductase [Actinomadura rudentiformis]KAB2344866.1 phosphoadenosine phosphosulfate reductase [Actinomadura rudentiformis]